MKKAHEIRAQWDDTAKAWIATSEDVPGLCCQAESLEALKDVALALAPELLVENEVLPAGDYSRTHLGSKPC
jgi:hypothetical protein